MARKPRARIRHPATAERFDWDDLNLEKLAARGISDVDVESVWLARPEYRRNKRAGTARWFMIGRDLSGRRLKIGIIWKDQREGVLRAITGWPLSD